MSGSHRLMQRRVNCRSHLPAHPNKHKNDALQHSYTCTTASTSTKWWLSQHRLGNKQYLYALLSAVLFLIALCMMCTASNVLYVTVFNTTQQQSSAFHVMYKVYICNISNGYWVWKKYMMLTVSHIVKGAVAFSGIKRRRIALLWNY